MSKEYAPSTEHLPLIPLVEEKDLEFSDESRRHPAGRGQKRSCGTGQSILVMTIIVQVIIIVALLGVTYSLYRSELRSMPLKTQVYSPVQEAIEPQLVKFTFGIDNSDKTIYQGLPSEEVDSAWLDLYRYPASAIPKSEAAKMANKTSPIPGDESNYIIIPDVFHTLHCLNIIRKALSPEYYNSTEDKHLSEPFHVSHCIDAIRQSLMCCSDVSPIIWRWNGERNISDFRPDVVHECRNFEKIQKWAEEHHVERYDRRVQVEDDLDIPVLYF